VIQRVYVRTDDPKTPRFAVCFDGTNHDEVLALLNFSPTDGLWTGIPLEGVGLRVVNNLRGESLILSFGVGQWAVQGIQGEAQGSGSQFEDAAFVAAFSLADAALAP